MRRCRHEEDGLDAVVNIVKKFLRIQNTTVAGRPGAGQKRFDLEIFRIMALAEDALARHAPLLEGDDAAGIARAMVRSCNEAITSPPDAA